MVGPTLSFYHFLQVGNQDPKEGTVSKLKKEESSLGEAKAPNPSSVNKIAKPKKAEANASKLFSFLVLSLEVSKEFVNLY